MAVKGVKRVFISMIAGILPYLVSLRIHLIWVPHLTKKF